MKAGDQVLYVPHEIHARTPDHRGRLPWAIGVRGRRDDGVKRVQGEELNRRLHQVKKNKSSLDKEGLVLMHPVQLWRATVRAVSADGKTADLDILSPTGFVTLHDDGVEIDPTGKKAHSCHEVPKAQPANIAASAADVPAFEPVEVGGESETVETE